MSDAADDRQELEELKASDLRSRTILESITDGFFTLDRDWRFDYVNPEADRILGCEPGALLGKVLWQQYPGTVGTAFEETYRRVVASRTAESFLAYCPDHASWYDVRAFPAPAGLTVYFRDVTQVKQTEAALRASEERRRLALDAAELGAWNFDPASGGLIADERFRLIWGTGAGDLDYDRVMALVHPEDRTRIADAVAAATREVAPAPYAVELRVMRTDGSVRWLYSRGRATFDGDGGKLLSLDGTVVDITERKHDEEKFRQGERRLRMALEAARMVAWDYDPSTGIVTPSENAAAVFGLVPGKPLDTLNQGLSLVHPDDAEPYAAVMKKAIDDCGSYVSQYRLIRPVDGQTIWLEERGHASRDGASGPVCVAGVVADITERKNVEARLREAEEEFRTLADNMAQFAWMADAAGWLYWYNQRWYDYTGTNLEDMQGWGWKAVHHPDHIDRVVERFQRFLSSGEPWEDTFPLRGRDGSFRWFLSRAAPIRSGDGKLVRWFGTNTDITEQRNTAEALRQVAAELSHADRRKNEFLATLAHELRNPLAPIQNSLEIIRLTGNSSLPVEKARQVMERQIRQMARLVDDLLDVSRIATDKLELRKERVDLAAVVASAVETSRPLLDANGVQLTVVLPPESIPLDADLTRLAQVFMNLLNNAAKFTHRGGRVSLTAAREGAEVVVTVQDNGLGIAAEDLGGIFEMFSQVGSSLDRSHGGLGIGLTLVRQLVELHGGRVEARSAGLGNGSEFVVRLALATPDAQSSAPAANVDGGPQAPLRVLVVDDNQDAADSLAAMLEMMGHETRTTHDGLAAFDAAAAWRPDLLLLDIGLPGLNGYEVANRIRRQPWGAAIMLCAMTGWGQDSDKQKSKGAGFDRHLVKPVASSVVAKLLGEVKPRVG